MRWYTVLIGHDGSLRDAVVQREDSPRTRALVEAGLLAPLGVDDEMVPEVPATFGLEPEPAKRVRRGKQAETEPAAGEAVQSPAGAPARDEGDGAD